jgi:hypothetical protein
MEQIAHAAKDVFPYLIVLRQPNHPVENGRHQQKRQNRVHPPESIPPTPSPQAIPFAGLSFAVPVPLAASGEAD